MKNYIVMDIKKNNGDNLSQTNGHIQRRWNSKNIDPDRTHLNENIIVPKYESAGEYLSHTKEKISSYNKTNGTNHRNVRMGKNFYMQILISHSKDAFSEDDAASTKYHLEALEWLKKRFPNQEILYANIHNDETTRHMHVGISFFNEKECRFTQKELMKKGLTDFGKIHTEFAREIGKKYGLERGEFKSKNKGEKPLSPQVVKKLRKKERDNFENKFISEISGEPYTEEVRVSRGLEIPKKEEIPCNWHYKQMLSREKYVKKLEKTGMKLKEIDSEILEKEKYLVEVEEQQRKAQNQIVVGEWLTEAKKTLTPDDIFDTGKFNPQNSGRGKLMKSPLRGDKNPSFSVFLSQRGEWMFKDLSTGDWGDMVELYMKLNDKDLIGTMNDLTQTPLYEEHKIKWDKEKKRVKNSVELEYVETDVKDSRLLDYLSSRKIEKIPKWLRQQNSPDGKISNLMIHNDSGGINLRGSGDFKRSYGTNSPTTILSGEKPSLINNNKPTVVVEGLFDALSFYQVYGEDVNYKILNSTSNIDRVLREKNENTRSGFHLWVLDNDLGGQEALNKIKSSKTSRDLIGTFNEAYNDISEAFMDKGSIKYKSLGEEIHKWKMKYDYDYVKENRKSKTINQEERER